MHLSATRYRMMSFFFSSRRRHTRFDCDWSSDVCSSDLALDRRPFAEALRARVLAPLGMTSSAPVITNPIRARTAVGYSPLYDDRPFPLHGQLAEAPWIEVDTAAGGVASTSVDMTAYLHMLIN